MSIKYYRLAKDEEPPEEFCAVRDVGDEPSEYVFYVPESENTELRMRITSLEAALEGMHLKREQDMAENAKLRELCSKFAQVVANDDVTFRKLREIAKRELGYDFIGAYDSSLGDMDQLPLFSDHMRELGVEVDG